jgi:uncharacterized membrane protein
MEEFFKAWTQRIASGVETSAALIIAIAAFEATLRALLRFVHRTALSSEAIRLRLGRWLSLALEFELAADILRTAVAPTWNEIGQLAAIVVLRTALNFFLQKEIDIAETRRQSSGTSSPSTSPRSPLTPESMDEGTRSLH